MLLYLCYQQQMHDKKETIYHVTYRVSQKKLPKLEDGKVH